MAWWHRLKEWARRFKRDVKSLTLALLDPRTPWYAKALAGFIVAYAVSPVDIIPDAIPVLGLIDDLILLPLMIAGVTRLIPAEVMADCRGRADRDVAMPRWLSWTGFAIVTGIWLVTAFLIARWFGAL